MTRRHSRQAVVVGAGIVGLSVAWFLQEEGFQVTVLDRNGVAAGASAGNAGWICPGFATPLPEPSVLKYALRSLAQRDSALRVAPAALPHTAAFFARFALSCSDRAWRRGVVHLARLGALAQESYDLLQKGGVSGELVAAPMLLAFGSPPDAAPVWHELRALAAAGQGYPVTELDQAALREAQLLLSARATCGLRLDGPVGGASSGLGRRPAADRRDPAREPLRRGRPRHVGDDTGPGDRPPARRAHRNRHPSCGTRAVRSVPVTRRLVRPSGSAI